MSSFATREFCPTPFGEHDRSAYVYGARGTVTEV